MIHSMSWHTYTTDMLGEKGPVVRTADRQFFEVKSMTLRIYDGDELVDGDDLSTTTNPQIELSMQGYPLTQDMHRRIGGRGDHVMSTHIETLTDVHSKRHVAELAKQLERS